MSNYHPELRSELVGQFWPAIQSVGPTLTAALLFQLEQTQWWPAERLREFQFRQMRNILGFASQNSPGYQRRMQVIGWDYSVPITQERWEQIPTLKRGEMSGQSAELRCRSVPKDHAPIKETSTSGSTGQPVKCLSTSVTRLMWDALTIRFHLWHRHDFSGKFCAVRAIHGPINPQGREAVNWGSPVAKLFQTGPAALMDCRQNPEKLARWLVEQKPAYVLGVASVLKMIAEYCADNKIAMPSLKEAIAYAETVKPEHRDACRRAWGVGLADMYSCHEAGYIAIQCPQHEQYHIQSESMLVEVLDDDNKACKPGQAGRVVISSLLNLAMPTIRYEIGDFAEVGEPCPCGRGLPVIKRILGRQRNVLRLPDGSRLWPMLETKSWATVAPIRQLQLVQKSPQHIAVKLVMDRPVTSDEEAALTTGLRQSLAYPFDFSYTTQPDPIRSPVGKFESVISEVP